MVGNQKEIKRQRVTSEIWIVSVDGVVNWKISEIAENASQQ